jgi:hypothetical protein
MGADQAGDYPWRMTTERLDLHAIGMGDLEDLYELNSDPRVWTHFPSGVHTTREQTTAHIAVEAAGWKRFGLGYADRDVAPAFIEEMLGY